MRNNSNHFFQNYNSHKTQNTPNFVSYGASRAFFSRHVAARSQRHHGTAVMETVNEVVAELSCGDMAGSSTIGELRTSKDTRSFVSPLWSEHIASLRKVDTRRLGSTCCRRTRTRCVFGTPPGAARDTRVGRSFFALVPKKKSTGRRTKDSNNSRPSSFPKTVFDDAPCFPPDW